MGKFPRELDENARATPHGRTVFPVFISHLISSPFSNEAFSDCLSHVVVIIHKQKLSLEGNPH